MIDFKISILPFIANFFLSWLYYSPLVPWFKTWQIGIGMDPNITELTEDVKNSMPRLMGGAVIASLLLSYGLQIIVHSVNATDFLSGALVGLVLWLLTYTTFGGIIALMS